MNHHDKQINHVLILGRSKDDDSTDTMCCVTYGDPWSAKQHSWKSEAKEEYQLTTVDQATDERAAVPTAKKLK